MDERTGQRFQTRPGNGNQSEGAAKNQISAPSISLPKGGGALRGMGEKFAANPVTGTGSRRPIIGVRPLICDGNLHLSTAEGSMSRGTPKRPGSGRLGPTPRTRAENAMSAQLLRPRHRSSHAEPTARLVALNRASVTWQMVPEHKLASNSPHELGARIVALFSSRALRQSRSVTIWCRVCLAGRDLGM